MRNFKTAVLAFALASSACGRSELNEPAMTGAMATDTSRWRVGDCTTICFAQQEQLIRDFAMPASDFTGAHPICALPEFAAADSSAACRCAFVDQLGIDFPHRNVSANAYLAPAATPGHCTP